MKLIVLVLVLLMGFSSLPEVTKPATPVSVVVLTDYYANDTKANIQKYVRQGYIVKAVSNGGDNAMIITVLEKY